MGVNCGADLSEAPSSSSSYSVNDSKRQSAPTVSKMDEASLRKCKCKALKITGGKPKRSRKNKGRSLLRIFDDDTDGDDRRDDDRIMNLFLPEVNPEKIDRLYCCEGVSAKDVEWHFASSSFPDL